MRTLFRTFVWSLEIAASLAFFVILFVAALPWLLSMQSTRPVLLALVQNMSGKHIVIEEVSLEWFGPQCLKGITVHDEERHALLSCDEIQTSASLWQIIAGDHDIGDLQILTPYLVLETMPATYTPLVEEQTAFLQAGPPPLSDLCSLGGRAVRRFSGQIHLHNGTVKIDGPQIDPIYFNTINGMAKLPSPIGRLNNPTESLEFQLQGTTSQDAASKEIQGNFHFTGTLTPCKEGEAVLAVQGAAAKLPVLGLDQIVSLMQPEMSGMLVAALGSTLNLTTSLFISQEKGECALELSSPQATASLFATTQDGNIVLRQPATCFITLTPKLVEFLFATSPYFRGLSLSSSSKLQLTLDNLSIPFGDQGIEWFKASAKAELQLDQIDLKSLGLAQKIRLTQLHASSKVGQLENTLIVDAGAQLNYGDLQSTFNSVIQASGPLEHARLQTFTLSADSFPVAVLDELLIKNGDLAEILGDTFDLRIGLESTGDDPVATVYFSTPNFAVPGAFVALKPNWHLQQPLKISYTPSKSLLQRYLPDLSMTTVGITVHDFIMDKNGSPITHIKIVPESLSIKNFSMQNSEFLLNIEGWENIAVSLQGDTLRGAWNMSYDPNLQRLSTQKNIDLSATVAPSLGEAFSPSPMIMLVQPAELTLSINPFVLRTGHGMLSSFALEGALQIKDWIWTRRDHPASRFALTNFVGRFKFDKPRGELAASGNGEIAGRAEGKSPFYIEGLLRRSAQLPASTEAAGQFELVCKCNAEGFDTTALDILLGGSSSFSSLLGSRLSVKIDTLHTPAASSLSLNVKSDNIQLNCGLARERNQLLLRSTSNPITCNLALSPEGYAIIANLWQEAYGQPIPLTLAKSTQVIMRIDTLAIPLLERSFTFAPDALTRALFSSNFLIERLPLTDTTTGEPLTFQHLTMQVQRKTADLPLEVNLKSTIAADKPGLLDVRGSVGSVSRNNRDADSLQMHIKMEANFQDVPTSFPDLGSPLMGLKPCFLATLLGPTLTGSLHADLLSCSGPVSLQVNTALTRLSLKGRLAEGVLALDEPFLAQVTLNEATSRMFLQKTNPLSLDVVTSEGPMTLTVDKKGFSLPIFPWNIAAATIPKARIDLGRITCHNTGNISSMLGLLKLAQFSRDKDLQLWFAPLDVSIKNSVVDCSRTEVLIDNRLDIATWGKIDLDSERVDAVLGITASALETALGIKGLPEDYVLQIPMKGPIGNVQIDTSKATAKMALLLAWKEGSSAAGGMLGGPQGAVVGGLLGKLAQLPDSKTPAPPAKHPFPWESEQAQPKPTPKNRKTAFKPGDKPLKQLLKLIR